VNSGWRESLSRKRRIGVRLSDVAAFQAIENVISVSPCRTCGALSRLSCLRNEGIHLVQRYREGLAIVLALRAEGETKRQSRRKKRRKTQES